MRYVGVDEKAFRKEHVYHTVVCNLERSTVEYVGEGRSVESLAPFYAGLILARRDGLQAIAMDMWDPYIKATRDGLPDGDERIVFDCFHVMRDITTAVDLVRKHEHRALLRETGASVLTGTKYLWLYARGASADGAASELQARAHAESEGRTRLGHQRGAARPVDVPSARRG